MKKIYSIISGLAIASMAFVGCQQEIKEEINPAKNTITLNFAAETVDPTSSKASLTPNEDETAFAAAWENNDKIGISAASASGEINNVMGTWTGSAFSTDFEGSLGDEMSFVGVFPYNEEGEIEFGSGRVQNGNDYNSAYDVMKSEAVPAALTENATIVLPMHRQTAIAYFHLTGTPAEGETVQSATLTIDADENEPAKIAGDIIYVGGEIATEGTSNSITITFAEGTNPSAGDFTLWFNVLPVSYKTLKLEVTTENYTLTINNTNPGSYEAGKLYKVSAEVPTTMWVEKGGDTPSGYMKVTEAPTDWSGEYLLVYETTDEDSNPVGYCWTGVDAADCYAEAAIENGVISKPDGAVTVTIASMVGGYSIQVNGGTNISKFIKGTSGSNALGFDADAQLNTISYNNDDECVDIVSNTSVMRYNSDAKNNRFRYFKSTSYTAQQVIQLYKYTGASKQNQTLSFPQESYDVVLGETFTAPTVTGAQTTVTYSSSDVEVATVDATSGAVQILSAGEVTITATACSDDTYNEGSASYTISIIAPDSALTTVAGIFEASEEAGNYMVTFDDWVVSGVKGDNAYVTDGTNGFIIYKEGHGFVAGDILSGTVNSCALTRYNGAAEFTNITSTTEGLTVTKGGSITPATFSISELSGVNTGSVISFDDLTYNVTVFTDGANNIKPYNAFITLPELTTGAHYKVTGVYIQYGETKEIAPRTNEDISEIAATKYTITIADGILYGSVSADKAEAAAGVEVTLTATPDTGYGFDAWNVKDAGNNIITVTNNKFTMPASNVTVSATFKDVSSESGTVEFDFSSTKELAKLDITAPAAGNGTTLTSCTISPITISNTKNGGTPTRVWNSSGNYDLRVYSGAELSFTSSSNVITKIQFEGTSAFDGVSNGVWTGSSSTVVLDCTSNSKITKITVTYGNPPVPPYLNASADMTNVSAAGETVIITVDTNVEGWTVTSDNDEFTVGQKDGNTVPVTVSENTSTTDGRTANITISADGVDDVVITLTQAKVAGQTKQYTAIITVENLDKIGTGTGYTPYNGVHNVVATASDGSKKTMSFESSQVMPGTGDKTGKLQFQASKGVISGTDWGTIDSITADSALTITKDGGDFSVAKKSSGAGYYSSITIIFTAE